MENSKNRNNEYPGVNKAGKNIKKSPLHQPSFVNNAAREQPQLPVHPQPQPQPQPQVYNISKSDFRDIVQQLTGSPSRTTQECPPRPAQNSPKPQSTRLQKIRPPPLPGVNRPNVPSPMPVHVAPPPQPLPRSNMYPRQPAGPAQFAQPPTSNVQPLTPPGNSLFTESPVSAYMRYLQHSMLNPSPIGGQPPPPQPQQQQQPQPQFHPQLQPQQPQFQPPMQPQSHPQALNNFQGQGQPPPFPNPSMSGLPSPRMSGPIPQFNGSFQPAPNLPSPHMNGPSFLPSPTSQFPFPSPNCFANLPSPRSPYPLLSPGSMFPPVTPSFAFSPTAQSGFYGFGTQPPLSPGLPFPTSPSGFFPLLSPRW